MHKLIKCRHVRLDSQYILKLLILFNVFLGIYLLFLSTNYRKYNEYAYDNSQDISNIIPVPKKADSKLQITKLSEEVPKRILKPNYPDSNEVLMNENNKPLKVAKNNLNNDPISVDKIYDSNNKLVVQESDNTADASYKRIEEDYKTLDENDKLRIEMLDKQGNQNSIIHDMDFSDDKPSNSNNKLINEPKVIVNNLKSHITKVSDDLSKDVINRILDHNLHINKNNSKLIVPEAINVETIWWTSEVRGKYIVLKDYVQSNLQPEPNVKSITLTTQGTPEFLYHVVQLCDRWDGFISLAVYAPGDDFRLAVNIIYYLRQCGNKCVHQRVSWHMVFDQQYSTANVSVPASFLETQNFDCNISLEETMRLLNIKSNFRQTKSLPYPINVLRNVARIGSKTKYIFASDIELYPSVGIVPAFFDLLKLEESGSVPLINSQNKHVYVVPIFEVKADISPPKTKSELSKLFQSNDAIFFHRYVCDICQNFPGRDIWIKQLPPNNTLNVFRRTRRTHDKNSWEPLYIGTNDEPFYDERLSWEGKRDKMSQMYEMCLMNYDLLILDNAFLVHAPGIKHYHAKDDSKRLKFIKQNQRVYINLMATLRKKYGSKNSC